jgi:hypothetical protein
MLACSAVLDLIVGRLTLPVVRRKWASSALLFPLDVTATVLVVFLIVGSAALIVWLGLSLNRASKGVDTYRVAVWSSFGALWIAQVAHLVFPTVMYVNLIRHGIALVVVFVVASEAILRGTTLARSIVGFGAITLALATLYRGLLAFMPLGDHMRWMAVGAETSALLLPWFASLALYRGQRQDWLALAVAGIMLVVSGLVVWGITPAIRMLVAQAMGFRFALPPLVHTLSASAYTYFIVRALLTPTVPIQATWAFIWLAFSGMHMDHPQVALGSVIALAILAWAPPMSLPGNLGRGTGLRPQPTGDELTMDTAKDD